MAEHWIGLDLGSSRVRAVVLGGDGIAGRAWRPLPARHPRPGRVEHDPDALVDGSLEVLRAALADAGLEARDAAGLGIVTQRATLIAWDAATGRALGPAVGWQDQRGAEIRERLVERGIPAVAGSSAPKLAWWLEHEPAVATAAARGRLRVGTPDAWLQHRLAGHPLHATDPGQASCTALYDVGRRAWAAPILERLGIAPETLPRVEASAAPLGETRAGLLGAAIPLCARAGDQQAAAFGQGVRQPGDAKLTLGTGAILDVHTGGEPRAVGGGFPLVLWRLADGTEAFCSEGHVATAGATFEWLVQLGLLGAVERLDAEAADDAEGVVFVPALQGLGTPYHDASARGFVGGLTRGSDRARWLRAAIEGVAHRCADLVEALAPDAERIRVDGGLARSDALLAALADRAGCTVERPAEIEVTALGAARLASLALGGPDVDAQGRALGGVHPFAPRWSRDEREAARARWRAVVRDRVRSRSST